MFLPCSRIRRIGTQRFDGNEQVCGFVLPNRQMAFVGTQLGAGGAMRRLRTPIMHGQMHAVANAVRKRRYIQLAHLVLDPSPVGVALWLDYLDLTHHFSTPSALSWQAFCDPETLSRCRCLLPVRSYRWTGYA